MLIMMSDECRVCLTSQNIFRLECIKRYEAYYFMLILIQEIANVTVASIKEIDNPLISLGH
jgi:hypothetical protein